MGIEKKIDDSIREPLKNKGYDLVKISITGGKRTVVDISIDRFDNKPVSVDDCVAASTLISAILDVEDLVHGKYNLDVGSPGEYRCLNRIEDFERFYGNEIKIELISPINDRKKLVGKLVKIEQNSGNAVVYLDEECDTVATITSIAYSNIKKANVKRVFNNR